MTDRTAPTASTPSLHLVRRRKRIARQLRALRALDGQHRRDDILWAVLCIGGLGLLWLLVFLKLQWLSGSLPGAFAASLALGAGVWWLGRRSFTLAALIVMGLLIVLFEDLPSWPDSSAEDETKRKRTPRERLQAAIARREALLRTLGAAA